MSKNDREIGVFVLAKNEQDNIGRCLDRLRCSSWDVFVLDSGSTDDTKEIVAEYDFVELKSYDYTNHCDAYNQITTDVGLGYRFVVVLDADMIVSQELKLELLEALSENGRVEGAVEARVLMCVEGHPLPFGSLYPPKPFAFKVGQKYFARVGHGEALTPETRVDRLESKLTHDDRKNYASYLQTQVRYAQNLSGRRTSGDISGRDRIRVSTPFLVLAVPIVSYIFRLGFMSGKAGIIYALDRLIAEAIMYRQSLSDESSEEPPQ